MRNELILNLDSYDRLDIEMNTDIIVDQLPVCFGFDLGGGYAE